MCMVNRQAVAPPWYIGSKVRLGCTEGGEGGRVDGGQGGQGGMVEGGG